MLTLYSGKIGALEMEALQGTVKHSSSGDINALNLNCSYRVFILFPFQPNTESVTAQLSDSRQHNRSSFLILSIPLLMSGWEES